MSCPHRALRRAQPRCPRRTRPRCCGATAPTHATASRAAIHFDGPRRGPTPSSSPSPIRWANLFLAHGRARPTVCCTSACCSTTCPSTCSRSAAPRCPVRSSSGSNHTRRDEHLLRDIEHTHVGLIVTEAAPPRRCSRRSIDSCRRCSSSATTSAAALAAAPGDDPGLEAGRRVAVGADLHVGHVVGAQGRDLHAAASAADRCAHGGDHGPRSRRRRLRLHAAVPLERAHGRLGAVDRGRRVGRRWPGKFSASGWLADVRRYGATYFNYTGKPLSYLVATPEKPDDADNTVRVAFGNEGSPEVVETFARRFGVEVIDAFGATEGGIAVNRDDGMQAGLGRQGRRDGQGGRRRRQRAAAARSSTPTVRLLNADECVGEIVNTAGAGPFEGYYNNAEATSSTLAQRLVLVGRPRLRGRRRVPVLRRAAPPTGSGSTARTSRPGPIEAALGRHPDVVLAAVYGVPDEHAGDQVMAALAVARRRRVRPGRVRVVHRLACPRSARSGGRATCGWSTSSRRPARTRS